MHNASLEGIMENFFNDKKKEFEKNIRKYTTHLDRNTKSDLEKKLNKAYFIILDSLLDLSNKLVSVRFDIESAMLEFEYKLPKLVTIRYVIEYSPKREYQIRMNTKLKLNSRIGNLYLKEVNMGILLKYHLKIIFKDPMNESIGYNISTIINSDYNIGTSKKEKSCFAGNKELQIFSYMIEDLSNILDQIFKNVFFYYRERVRYMFETSSYSRRR